MVLGTRVLTYWVQVPSGGAGRSALTALDRSAPTGLCSWRLEACHGVATSTDERADSSSVSVVRDDWGCTGAGVGYRIPLFSTLDVGWIS